MEKTNGIFVTGTDTDVGKTQVTAGLAGALAARLRQPVRLWKPVQSGVSVGSTAADSFRLAHGSGLGLDEADIASLTLEPPLAPWIAARRTGHAIDYEALLTEGRHRLNEPYLWLVEGAGGLLVPLTERKLVADLASDLGLPLVIVARAGLGTVNHTLLTIQAARQRGMRVLGVIVNGFRDEADPALGENVMMIEHFGETRVLAVLPWLPAAPYGQLGWEKDRDEWIQVVDRRMQWAYLEQGLRRT